MRVRVILSIFLLVTVCFACGKGGDTESTLKVPPTMQESRDLMVQLNKAWQERKTPPILNAFAAEAEIVYKLGKTEVRYKPSGYVKEISIAWPRLQEYQFKPGKMSYFFQDDTAILEKTDRVSYNVLGSTTKVTYKHTFILSRQGKQIKIISQEISVSILRLPAPTR